MTEEFKVLTDREHALHRPGMYIGSTVPEPQSAIINYEYTTKTVAPGLIKIIEEIIQNSIDEAIRTNFKFANEINVNITSNIEGWNVTVEDNGRGIPQDLIDGKPRAQQAWTSLRAGSNFDDSKRIGVGANGVGSSLTNIFSQSFVGDTADGKSGTMVTCYNNMSTVSVKQYKTKNQGTTVSFYPDLQRFSIDEITQDHIDVIFDRLTNWAIMYPEITFTFNDKKIKIKSIKEIASKFHEDAVAFEVDNMKLVLAPTGSSEEFRCLSYVNGIYIKNGGTHVDFVIDKVVAAIRANVKKKHKIDVMPNQIKQHLLFASWIRAFPALKFDSQSKERVTNTVSEVSQHLTLVDTEKLASRVLATPSIIDPMIESILYKRDLAEAREMAKKAKEGKKKVVINHIAATDPNPENRMLLLCEGLSAIGPLISVRNAAKIGGYPLKGKVMNVHGMRPLEIMKNVEIQELLSVIGLTIGEPAKNLNYGKIGVFTDADLDGSHIYTLLINLFSLWPELFAEKRIYRLNAPLFYCKKGKTEKLFYTHEEFEKFDATGYQVSYYKGLGSMPEEVYDRVVNNPVLECVTGFDKKVLNMAFGDDSDLRKDWMMS